MSTSREKMQQARELIAVKRYDEARAILRTVNHDTALDWLDKIDKLDPPESPKPKRKQHPILALLLLILAICILGIGVVYVHNQVATSNEAVKNALNDLDNKAIYCETYCKALNRGPSCVDICMNATSTPSP